MCRRATIAFAMTPCGSAAMATFVFSLAASAIISTATIRTVTFGRTGRSATGITTARTTSALRSTSGIASRSSGPTASVATASWTTWTTTGTRPATTWSTTSIAAASRTLSDQLIQSSHCFRFGLRSGVSRFGGVGRDGCLFGLGSSYLSDFALGHRNFFAFGGSVLCSGCRGDAERCRHGPRSNVAHSHTDLLVIRGVRPGEKSGRRNWLL